MKIFLIRHGESQANVNKSVHLTVPDHEIALSNRGKLQAKTVGIELLKYINAKYFSYSFFNSNPISKFDFIARIWNSPYRRTRETSQEISNIICNAIPNVDCKEHILLHEQNFGLFDGVPDEELSVKFPDEYAHYKKHEDFQGKFWARMPLGESRADVLQRVHQSFGTFHRDAKKHGIENLIIVSHGTTIRAFVTAWCGLPWEFMENEKNPNNCSIRLIVDNEDQGYIFKGFNKYGDVAS